MNELREIKSILQTTPKGSYYEGSDEQLDIVIDKCEELLEEDRSLFAVSSLLPGTNYSKGLISHLLLNNSIGEDIVDYPLMYNWNGYIEMRIVLYNLRDMGYARAIKNMLMFLGREDGIDFECINNTRNRKIVTNYVFGRDDDSLEYLAVKFKNKLESLFTRALGYRDLMCIIKKEKDWKKQFNKYFKPIDSADRELFNHERVVAILSFVAGEEVDYPVYHFSKIELYNELSELAKERKEEEFLDKVKANPNKIPTEVIESWIGCFQLDIDLNEAMEHGNMTDSQKMNRKRTSERKKTKSNKTKREKDVDLDIDYENQSLYDLVKMMFARRKHNEEVSDELIDAIDNRVEKEKLDIDLGEVVTILDKSDSMKGSEKRELHPFINGISIAYTLKSDDIIETGNLDELYPSGNTNLAESLLEVVEKYPDVDTVVVVSDGYENTVKGMFEKVYNRLQDMGYEFSVVHVNPVQTSDIESIKLLDEVEPISVENNQMLETHFALSILESKPEVARKMFIEKMKNKLGEGINYERLKGQIE